MTVKVSKSGGEVHCIITAELDTFSKFPLHFFVVSIGIGRLGRIGYIGNAISVTIIERKIG